MSFRVAGIGEVLWDRFPDADRLGGAPANFVFHATQLGAEGQAISRVGRDPDGFRLLKTLTDSHLSTDLIQQDSTYPTGLVRVKITDGQPSYTIESPSAWDHLDLLPALESLAQRLDAVCFGTLAQRNEISRQTIQNFIKLCPGTAFRLFDINLRQTYFTRQTIEFGLNHATALKLNEDELERIAEIFTWSVRGEEAIAHLFKLFPLTFIAVTRGAAGCNLHSRTQVVHAKAPKVVCADAVGAGDAFSAALVMGFLRQYPLQQIAEHANRVGAYVASQSGAMPTLPPELLQP